MAQKVSWEPEDHKIFVDLCVERKQVLNITGTLGLLESFQKKSDKTFDKNQLKNRWDTMVRQWRTWNKLVQCSDMKWDPETKTFGVSEEDWYNYLQANPDAMPYRMNLPADLEKLEIIFKDYKGCRDDVACSCWNQTCRKHDDQAGSSRRKRTRQLDAEDDTGDGDEDMEISSNFLVPQSRRGCWSEATHERLLDLLVLETNKGKILCRFNEDESWRMILETINQECKKCYKRKHLKRHWCCTRDCWKIWCQLVGEASMKWDPNTRTFGATDEEWRIYLAENPKAAKYRTKQIQFADKLATIFKGAIEPGKVSFCRHSKKVVNDSKSRQQHDSASSSTFDLNEPITEIENGDEDNDVFAEFPMCTPEEVKMLKESPLIVQKATEEQCKNTIGECIESLEAMEEIERGSDLYLFTLDLFLRKEFREIFLLLKPSLRITWVLSLQAGPFAAA